MSPRTVVWYRERLTPFFRHLEVQLSREPALADITIPAFRLFILEKQTAGKYQDHRFKRASQEPPSAGHIHGLFRAVRGFSSWLFDEGLLPVESRQVSAEALAEAARRALKVWRVPAVVTGKCAGPPKAGDGINSISFSSGLGDAAGRTHFISQGSVILEADIKLSSDFPGLAKQEIRASSVY